jgi:hypothetical protein
MDLRKTIEDLHREREMLDRAIASLEELQGAVTAAAPTKCRRRESVEPRSSETLAKDDTGDDGRAQQPAVCVTV